MYAVRVSLAELQSVQRKIPATDAPSLVFVQRDGLTLPALNFHEGSLKEVMQALREHVTLTKSDTNPDLFLLSPLQTAGPMLSSTPRASIVQGQNDPATAAHRQRLQLQRSLASLNIDPAASTSDAPDGEADHDHQDDSQVMNLLRETFWGALERFSKVTKYSREFTGALSGIVLPPAPLPPASAPLPPPPIQRGSSNLSSARSSAGRQPLRPRPAFTRPAELSHHENSEPTDSDDFFMIVSGTPPANLDLFGPLPNSPPLDQTRTAMPLGRDVWQSLFDAQGRISAEKEAFVRERIFRGGVEPGLRGEVWLYLLGVWGFSSTAAERAAQLPSLQRDYEMLALQWKSVLPGQEANFTKFRERRALIEKDVARTDRDTDFFGGELTNPNLEMLHRILMSYTYWDWDLGYVQGMSDLLSPILFQIRDEVLAFWAFEGLMRSLKRNFLRDQSGIHAQLNDLRTLTQFVDPTLYTVFEQRDAINFFFSFRWIIIIFKREFSFEELPALWEALWSGYCGKNFQIFVCLALLELHRDAIIHSDMAFDEILKFVNELSGHLHLARTLVHAETLYMAVKGNCPAHLKHLL
eukprot:TRINITY_DN914_c0_g1_i1.p1 TRINITY_DN914_c0_g1~~TRINITY_DN914_c0_g1_i1.p1  ORF type:complete len:672 (+),score=164.54 TRINITY_DN914_c0_g1_i1:272-2017(+)